MSSYARPALMTAGVIAIIAGTYGENPMLFWGGYVMALPGIVMTFIASS